MKKIFILIILLLPMRVFAYSYIVLDNDSGRVLDEYNSNKSSLIASTTKIMTCMVVLNNVKDLNKTVRVGEEVLKMYGTNIYLEVGEEMRVIDLLYGLMLRSGNDASVALAVYTSGSTHKFVSSMNKLAKSLGMDNTKFSNPHGLDEESENYSTARDMAILSHYAFKNKIYRKIISTSKYRCKSNLKSYLWYNRVSILNSYKYSLGGKNGYTPRASKSLVSYAKRGKFTLICVSLGDSDIYERHKYLFNKAYKRYKLYKIIDKNNFKYDKNIIDGNLYIKKNFYYPLTYREIEEL